MTQLGNRGLVLALIALLIMAAVLPLLTGAEPQPRGGDTVVRFVPQEATVGVGETITLAVVVDNVQEMYGLHLKFSFDPAYLTAPVPLVVVNQEVFPPGSMALTNTIDNGAGLGTLIVTKMNPDTPYSGSAKLCDITLQGVADGFVAVEFDEVKPATRDGEAIEHTTVNAIIEVGDGGPTPTASPTSQPVGDVPTATVTPEPTQDALNKVALPLIFGE